MRRGSEGVAVAAANGVGGDELRSGREREQRRGWGRESERRVPEGVRGVVQTRRGSGVKQEVARACQRAATTRPPAYWQEVEDGGGDCWAGPAVLGRSWAAR